VVEHRRIGALSTEMRRRSAPSIVWESEQRLVYVEDDQGLRLHQLLVPWLEPLSLSVPWPAAVAPPAGALPQMSMLHHRLARLRVRSANSRACRYVSHSFTVAKSSHPRTSQLLRRSSAEEIRAEPPAPSSCATPGHRHPSWWCHELGECCSLPGGRSRAPFAQAPWLKPPDACYTNPP